MKAEVLFARWRENSEYRRLYKAMKPGLDAAWEAMMTRKGSGGGKHQEQAAVQKERTKCPICRGQRGHKCHICNGTGWIE